MFDKLSAFWRALQAGQAVANAVQAKQWTLAVNALGTFAIVALNLVHLFGVLPGIDLSTEQVGSITAGVVTVLGVFNHGGAVISTDKIDVLGRATVQPVGAAGEGDAAGAGVDRADPRAVAVTRPAASVQSVAQADARPGSGPEVDISGGFGGNHGS